MDVCSVTVWHRIGFSVFMLLQLFNGVARCQPYVKHQRCSNRLENALEHMRRRSIQVKSSRSLWDNPASSPYQLYHSFYGAHSDPNDDYYGGGGGGNDGEGNYGSYGGRRGYYAKNIHRSGPPHHVSGELDLEEIFSSSAAANLRQPHKLTISRVDVEDLKVRVPPAKSTSRWVEIDKCKFSTENSTLDTRLIFPDLTLSGKVVMQPAGGKCNMILRLRHAGIEFRTIPIGFEAAAAHEESRRLGAASVRTDSHFAEPGFISVFAHGCQGPSGIRLRQNSKRRFGYASGAAESSQQQLPITPEVALSEPHVILGTTTPLSNTHRWGKFQNLGLGATFDRPNYDIRTESYLHQQKHLSHPQRHYDLDLSINQDGDMSGSREFYDVNGDNFYRRQFRRRRRDVANNRHRRHGEFYAAGDEIKLNDDIFNFADEQLQQLVQPDARAFADIFGGGAAAAGNGDSSSSGGGAGSEDYVTDAMSSELEKLFSMGVRGLLTTYMQRALQPAIKETLMENMGYTLSYG